MLLRSAFQGDRFCKKGVFMKRRMSTLFALTVLLVCLPKVGHGQDTAELTKRLEQLNAYPDMIVVNGKIAMVDAEMTTAQAMAVRDGRILALGPNEEIQSLAGPKTETLDVKGRTVLPGLVDAHTHAHTYAELHRLTDGYVARKFGPEMLMTFVRSESIQGMVSGVEMEIQKRAKELGPGKWIVVGMWSGDDLYKTRAMARAVVGRGIITTAWLDGVAPDNPVLVRAGGNVPAHVYNTRGREILREVLGTDKTNSASMQEIFLYDILLQGKAELGADVLKMELENCYARYGITAIRTRVGSPAVLNALNWLDRRGELPVRWAWIEAIGFYFAKDRTDYYRLFPDLRGSGSEYLWNIGVGNEAWEQAPWKCTQGKPKDPNRDPSELYWPPCNSDPDDIDYEASEMYRLARLIVERGLRLDGIHALGDGSYDALFRVIEQAISEGKITEEQVREMRIGVEHNSLTRPDQIAKLAKYGIYLTIQPFHYFRDSLAFVRDYGEQYLEWGMPLKSLSEAGVHLTINTAFHLTRGEMEERGQPSPESLWNNSIWPHYAFFVTREMEGQEYLPEQAIDRVEVIQAATIRGAELLLREKDLGSLEVGKFADFIVIDKDYFTIPANQIRTIVTLMTVVGGKTAYRSPQF